ncbi:YceI family protein [Sulfuricurvum sp.]|uniref:YceI family protein n=1 Tax=Sulfuricurvum sp. TaxID=2025608 RepID=UPI002E2FCD48|nr:YceI family protein [Sulfuricurvum sp.]HEX5329185.1 YceI family protein [Sulfuricurvum sp.]
MKKTISTIAIFGLLSTASLYAGTYSIDTSHSNVGFKVKHMMISEVSGKFDTFNGSFEYDEKSKTLKTLNGKVDVNSINTANTKRDDHLKAPDLFDVQKYPTITFALDKVKGDKAYGKLTMHGVTKNIILDLENNGVIKDPWGNTRVGLGLSGKLNRKDYGITWNMALEAGGVAVGDVIKLDVQLEGILAQ